FVSVGAGPIRSRAGGLLLRVALSLADYRSYRDEPSRAAVSALGLRTARDEIYPDLVFGLEADGAPGEPTATTSRPVVGLGLMDSPGVFAGGRGHATSGY